MSDPQRKQIRLSLPPDAATQFDSAKRAAEQASGIVLSDAQFAQALLTRSLKQP